MALSMPMKEWISATGRLPVLFEVRQSIAAARDTVGLIQHSGHGSQCVSIVWKGTLADGRVTLSTCTAGDSFNNALVGNVNGSYVNEKTSAEEWAGIVHRASARCKRCSGWNELRLCPRGRVASPRSTSGGHWCDVVG